jgi:hypothetical protein
MTLAEPAGSVSFARGVDYPHLHLWRTPQTGLAVQCDNDTRVVEIAVTSEGSQKPALECLCLQTDCMALVWVDQPHWGWP